MLLAVEGGFISSSASGYSKGLAFLLFGRRDDYKPPQMRVLPWTPHNHPHHHYQLFPAEIDSSSAGPLAHPKSGRAKIRRGCARFLLCFGRPSPDASASLPPLKVEPDDGSARVSASGCRISEVAADGVYDPVKFHPKSSLKKTLPGGGGKAQEEAVEKERVVLGTAAKRKVQWTDVHGRELTEIREFEPSEVDESGDERDENGQSCSCIIQ